MAGKAINLATAYVQIVPSMKNVGKSISEAFGKVDTTPEGRTAGERYAEGANSGFSSLKAGALAGVFRHRIRAEPVRRDDRGVRFRAEVREHAELRRRGRFDHQKAHCKHPRVRGQDRLQFE